MVKKSQSSRLGRVGALIGGALLALGIIWFGSLLWSQHRGVPGMPALSMPNLGATPAPAIQIPQLLAAGITLGHVNQTPALKQEQVLVIASELEPEAASKAKSVSAQYVLATDSSTIHPALNSTPVWMVWYQQIPLQPADASVDPTPYPHSSHDLYVFLDATTGKELLAIWV